MSTPVAAYHLPRGIARPPARRSRWLAGPVRAGAPAGADETPLIAAGLDLPELSPAAVTEIADRLRDAGRRLRRVPLAERVAAIDRVAERWLAPGFALRRLAVERVPLVTGYPARAVGLALDHLWHALRRGGLEAVVDAELGDATPPPPDLALHVLTGNVPGAGVFGMIAALLAGIPSLVKTARREPLLPALVAASLAAEDARLGAALAVAPWPGGDPGLDGAAIAAADLVLAYGRTETLAAVAAHAPRRLLRYGPRVSVALIAREAVDRQTAARAALQVALFDQQGCLSPQLLVVEESDPAATARFVAALGAELARLETTLPRAPLTLAEETAVWRHVERARWQAQEGEALAVHADDAGRFSVVCDRRDGHVGGSPLHRHVVVLPVAALADAGARLAPIAGCVEAVGYAGPERRLVEAGAVAAACDAPRLCPLDRMQRPPFAWRQSGHARLASLVAPASVDDGASPAATTAA